MLLLCRCLRIPQMLQVISLSGTAAVVMATCHSCWVATMMPMLQLILRPTSCCAVAWRCPRSCKSSPSLAQLWSSSGKMLLLCSCLKMPWMLQVIFLSGTAAAVVRDVIVVQLLEDALDVGAVNHLPLCHSCSSNHHSALFAHVAADLKTYLLLCSCIRIAGRTLLVLPTRNTLVLPTRNTAMFSHPCILISIAAIEVHIVGFIFKSKKRMCLFFKNEKLSIPGGN